MCKHLAQGCYMAVYRPGVGDTRSNQRLLIVVNSLEKDRPIVQETIDGKGAKGRSKMQRRFMDWAEILIHRRRCTIRWCEHWRHCRPSSSKLRDLLSTAATRLLINLSNL